MRTLIATAIVAPDGTCATSGIWSRAVGDESLATLGRCDAILYGRVGFVRDRAFWQRPDAMELPMARVLARYPKLVMSTTLAQDAGWHATVLRDREELRVRKSESGNSIVVFGSPTLLARLGDEVDEVRMVVAARARGGGVPWCGDLGLPLVEERELASGVTLRCYRR